MGFCFNEPPRIDDKTDAFYRRLIMLPFNIQIPDDRQNKKLAYEILAAEKAGVLNWAITGLKRLRHQGSFTDSPSVLSALAEYRKANNNVRSFVDDACMLEVSSSIEKAILYAVYKNYCEDSGFKRLSINQFGRELRRAYPQITESRTSGARCWMGITLK